MVYTDCYFSDLFVPATLSIHSVYLVAIQNMLCMHNISNILISWDSGLVMMIYMHVHLKGIVAVRSRFKLFC